MIAILKKRIFWGCLLGILVLAAIFIPRFMQMLEKSREGSAKGNLGSLKSAASIYYGDSYGIWPSTLEELIPKYLKAIPKDPITGSQKVVAAYDGTGGWVYDKMTGNVMPNFSASLSGKTVLVDDFEKNKTMNCLGGIWQVEQDDHKLGTRLKNWNKFIMQGGPNGSRYCGRIYGHFGKNIAPWPFASIYTSLALEGPADMSPFKAIEFMTRGDGKTYDLLVYLSQVTDFAHYRQSFQSPSVWTKVRLELKNFKQPDWGTKISQDYRSVKEILFAPSGMNDENFDLSLDDITFVK